MLVKQKTYSYICSWAEFKQSLKEIQTYINELKAQNKKPRLAIDTETYILQEYRDKYDELTPKKKKKEYPVPRPIKNRWGVLDSRVRLIQIGLNPESVDGQYLFDLDKMLKTSDSTDVWEFYRLVGQELGPVLDQTTLIGQNLSYEYGFFWNYFKYRLKDKRDLLLFSQILYMGDKLNHSLSDLYERYIPETKFLEETGKTYLQYRAYKEEEQTSYWGVEKLTESQLQYASDDVRLVWFVWESLLRRFDEWIIQTKTESRQERGLVEVALLENQLLGAISKAEVRGFKFDVDHYITTIKPYLEGKVKEAQDEVDKLYKKSVQIKRAEGRGKSRKVWFDEGFESYNLGSWRQIRAIPGISTLIDQYGLETTGEDDLKELIDVHPAVKWILQYKKARSFIGKFESENSGYLTCLDGEGYIHTSFHQIGRTDETIDTGRMSSTKPNLMQVPAQDYLFNEITAAELVKKCFVAPEGYKLIILDYSQIEPRMTAELTKDAFLLECYLNDKDMHAETAKTIFQLDFLPLSKGKTKHWRDKGKIMRLARTYGMGLAKFMKTVYVDTNGELDYIKRGAQGAAEAKEVIERLTNMTPAVEAKRREIEEEVKALPYQYKGFERIGRRPFYVAKSVLGRTRRFCLTMEEYRDLQKHPEEWTVNYKVYNAKTGKETHWLNKLHSKIRNAAREAFNNLIQSSCADLFKLAIVYIDQETEKLHDSGILNEFMEGLINFVHDEVIFLCKDEHVDIVKPMMEEQMLKAAQRFIKSIPVKVEGVVATSWSAK